MPSPSKKNHIDFRKDIFAVLFLFLGVFTTLCLASYSPTDPALNSASNLPYVKNWGGIVGAYVADVLYIVFGISAYFTSAIFLLLSVLQFLGRPIRMRVREAFYYVGMLACAASLIHLRFETVSLGGHAIAGGGIIGGLLGETLARYFNRPGAYIISTASLLLFTTLATKLSVSDMAKIASGVGAIAWRLMNKAGAASGRASVSAFKAGLTRARAAFCGIGAKNKKAAEVKTEKPSPAVIVKAGEEQPKPERTKKTRDDEVVTLAPIRQLKGSLSAPSIAAEPARAAMAEPAAIQENAAQEEAVRETSAAAEAAGAGPKILKRADAKPKAGADQLKFQKISAEGYEPPPISLLDAGEGSKVEIDEETLKKNSMLLEMKLKDFDVDGHVTAIHPGPVITMYEFEPAAGTKVNKIVGLQDDLSLTLGGRSVRIVPHLPGKAALGIEIPNSDRETVWLRQIASTPQFGKSQSKLAIALGSSTAGHPVVTDLAKMPHLLVAGATGSGKSVAINSFIISILLKSSPADVRFILVDPKMLELSIYDGVPHLLLPVVTKPKKAVTAMRWAIREMERRYRMLAEAGVRNILGYNEHVKAGKVKISTPEEAQAIVAADPEAVIHLGTLPYIVIIIDELADLMMTASQDMEECITRLAQMARAAGIHLILATQRPSVDVITGLIKANFPARIAFKVTARHDSRTILDGNGAETLLGNGDMLFMTPQGGNIIRIHGCYVTDDDISRVVAHLKEQGEPVYDESILAEPAAGTAGGEIEEGDDELYDQAVRLVAETKQASISMVQRRLRIGYNRAARMIERMEAEGVVGPAEGSKPRQVLAGGLNT